MKFECNTILQLQQQKLTPIDLEAKRSQNKILQNTKKSLINYKKIIKNKTAMHCSSPA